MATCFSLAALLLMTSLAFDVVAPANDDLNPSPEVVRYIINMKTGSEMPARNPANFPYRVYNPDGSLRKPPNDPFSDNSRRDLLENWGEEEGSWSSRHSRHQWQ